MSNRNPYRLQRTNGAAIKKNPVKALPLQPFKPGDICTTAYRPLHFSVTSPCKILAVRYDKRFVSEWAVTVDTSEGLKDLCSSHFSRKR